MPFAVADCTAYGKSLAKKLLPRATVLNVSVYETLRQKRDLPSNRNFFF